MIGDAEAGWGERSRLDLINDEEAAMCGRFVLDYD